MDNVDRVLEITRRWPDTERILLAPAIWAALADAMVARNLNTEVYKTKNGTRSLKVGTVSVFLNPWMGPEETDVLIFGKDQSAYYWPQFPEDTFFDKYRI